ncbi:MAG: hypothetical protein HQL60_08565 [Magnetococcales bacterium]|nr:hypothetical protein [Magnetococcales bacterium]
MKSVFVVIDGLIAPYDADVADVCPTWCRMAAVGRTGLVQWPSLLDYHPEENPHWLALFGLNQTLMLDGPTDLPLGWLQARSSGITAERGCWCRLQFTHLYRQRDELLLMSPWRTGQTVAECQELATAVASEWQQRGWTVHVGSGGQLLLSTERACQVRTVPLERLERQSLATNLPSGRDGWLLHQLLVTGQMVLARHEINRQRTAAGRMALNTPWLSGVGSAVVGKPDITSVAPFAHPGCCWTAAPVVAGLARLAGYRTVLLSAEEDEIPQRLDKMLSDGHDGCCVLHLTTPALLARHGLQQQRRERLAWIDERVLRPLTELLHSGGDRLTVCGGYAVNEEGLGTPATVPYASAMGRQLQRKPAFWQRSGLGRGKTVDMVSLVVSG